jgi:hypothetical protein
MDGKILFNNPGEWWSLVTTNYYSYTHTDFAIVNHHWLSGAVYYIVHSIVGWKGLHLFFIALNIASLLFFVNTARRRSSFWTALLITILILPLIAQRKEVRPEVFGYLISGFLVWLLSRIRYEGLSIKWLWVSPILLALWVNLHASFPVGLLIMGVFFVDAFLNKANCRKQILFIFVISLLATALNPSGISGALYPYTIFRDSGYAVFENQTLFFLIKWGMSSANFVYLEVVSALLVIGVLISIFKKNLRNGFPILAIATIVTLMAWLSLRHFTLCGMILIPAFAILLKEHSGIFRKIGAKSLRGIIIAAVLLSVVWQGYSLKNRWIVIGLEPNANKAAHFIKGLGLDGPVFSNFDIGGYLIYHLYPEEKLFVYNRPESFPPEFFREIYVPMQQDEKVWHEQLSTNNFNMIALYHGDRTAWAQQFIKSRLLDIAWTPIYVDSAVLIFLRNNEKNTPFIEEFGIPREQLLK